MNSESEDLIVEARATWQGGDSERALEVLSHPSLEENAHALFLMGEIHYSRQNWGTALNCFRRCRLINPNFDGALTYVDLILNILGFFHTDQFNP